VRRMAANKVDIRDAFFDRIYEIATKDKDVIFITADADAFSLRRYKKDLPDQFVNVGVAEQNMVAVSAGLALSGKKVFIYAIIPFITMRCYEHIKVNICSMNLPVTIIGAGAGLSFGNDGPTHHAMQDIAVMRTLPEITILNPCDGPSAAACAEIAYESNSSMYVRIDKGVFPALYNEEDNFSEGMKIVRDIRDINIISTGFMSHQAVEIADELEGHSIDVGIIDLCRIKPINESLLMELISQSELLVTIEENSILGGIGTTLSEILTDNRKNIPLKRIALEDRQLFNYGSRLWLHANHNLDVHSITEAILGEMAC
jgi:transketolase